jgi:ferredoxin
MTMKKVWIEDGCIVCGLSVDTCPSVFEIKDGATTATVKDGADLDAHAVEIREAAAVCPVGVIHYEES